MDRPQLPEHPFRTRDAARYGLSPKALRLTIDQGVVRRVFTGVVVRADEADSTALRANAAALVMSTHAVLCDRTAAWIHGVEVFRYAELDTVPPLECYVLRGHAPTDRRDCHGRTRDLLPEDWQLIDGVRVTTPIRTAVDLACTLRRREALAALDAFAREFALSTTQMNRLLWRYRRRRGVVQARELVQLMDPRAESRPESWTRLEIHDHGLPAPQPQFWITIGGVPTYRLDLAYPHLRIVVEYDGQEFHTSPEARARDEARRAWLDDHGWHVIVLTKHSFGEDALRAWTDELRRELRARGAKLTL